MSQQQMSHEGSYRDGPKASYTEYDGVPLYTSSPPGPHEQTGVHAQRIFVSTGSYTPSAGQRLALAITSLVLWIVIFLIVIVFLINIHYGFYYGASAGLLEITLMAGLLIFTALVIVINAMFNRKRG